MQADILTTALRVKRLERDKKSLNILRRSRALIKKPAETWMETRREGNEGRTLSS